MGFFDWTADPEEIEQEESKPEESKSESPRRGTYLTLSELKKVPPPAPLIQDMINLDSVTMLVGASRAFKSFLTIGMACSIAHPKMNTWEGYKVHEHGTVAYIAAEGGTGIYPRVLAWCEANAVSVDELEGQLLINPDPVQLDSAQDMEYQLQQFGMMPNLKMIVFDTKARVSGGLEENSATDQAKAIDMVDFIKRQTGAAVTLVHHTGKDGHGARGSSAWIGAVDTELTATREGDEMMVTLKSTKRKDSKDGIEYRFEMKEYEFGEFFDVTSSLVAIAMREDEAIPGGSSVGRSNDIRAMRILDELDHGDGETKSVWLRMLTEDGMAERTARGVMGKLIKSGQVREIGGSGNRTRYGV